MRSVTKNIVSEALTWFILALGAGAFLYYFEDITALVGRARTSISASPQESSAKPEPAHAHGFEREVRLRANDNGHFIFDAAIDGHPITLMADTGASLVVLTFEDAERLGLSPHNLDFSGIAQTANGVARIAPVTLDRVEVDDITERDVPAAVAERGALAVNLLGMSFLRKLSRFEMQGSDLVLVE